MLLQSAVGQNKKGTKSLGYVRLRRLLPRATFGQGGCPVAAPLACFAGDRSVTASAFRLGSESVYLLGASQTPEIAQDGGGIAAVLGLVVLVAAPALIVWAIWDQRRERARESRAPSGGSDDAPLHAPEVLMDWFYTRKNVRYGPITEHALLELAESGELSGEDLVWHAGWSEWRTAKDVAGLVAPPPIPGELPPQVSQPSEPLDQSDLAPVVADTRAEEPATADDEEPMFDVDAESRPTSVCVRHGAVAAMHHCSYCQRPICQTCTFDFPGGLHLCPDCAVRPPETLTPKRRSYLITSYVAAGLATLLITLMFTPTYPALVTTEAELDALLGGVSLLTWIVIIAGIAFGAMAKGKKARSAAVWGAWVWNIVLLVVWGVFSVIGIMMG